MSAYIDAVKTAEDTILEAARIALPPDRLIVEHMFGQWWVMSLVTGNEWRAVRKGKGWDFVPFCVTVF